MLPQEVEGPGAIIKVEELTAGGRVSISSSPAGRKVILNDWQEAGWVHGSIFKYGVSN